MRGAGVGLVLPATSPTEGCRFRVQGLNQPHAPQPGEPQHRSKGTKV